MHIYEWHEQLLRRWASDKYFLYSKTSTMRYQKSTCAFVNFLRGSLSGLLLIQEEGIAWAPSQCVDPSVDCSATRINRNPCWGHRQEWKQAWCNWEELTRMWLAALFSENIQSYDKVNIIERSEGRRVTPVIMYMSQREETVWMYSFVIRCMLH